LEAGVNTGLEKIKQTVAHLGKDEHGWRVATKGFGDRQAYAGNFTLRAAAAMAGIYGNDAAEALYPMLVADSDGQSPDASSKRYTLTFPVGQLPPANAFWSVTMYDRKTQLLIDNPLNRYLINSPMLPDLRRTPTARSPSTFRRTHPVRTRSRTGCPPRTDRSSSSCAYTGRRNRC
jgi:hypothetical protein